jgi:hypothetical protein
MASPSNVIRVPKPSRSSFNPDRPVAGNTLLLSQLKHAHIHEQTLPPDRRTGIDFESIKTEGRAAEYLRKLMGTLHPQAMGSGGK